MKSFIVALLEVRIYLKDKGDLSFSLVLPIAIFALMYGAFGGQSSFHGTAHVVNEDLGGVYSTLLVDRLEAMDNLDVELLTMPEAESKLERSDLQMVIYIPPGFSQSLSNGEQAEIIFKQRGNGGQEGQIVASIVRGAAERINQDLQVYGQVAGALAAENIPQEHILVTVQKFLNREHAYPIVGIREETAGSSPDPVNQFLPGIVTMFVLFAITLSARTIVEERKKGTLDRLLTTQLSMWQLFTGKFMANVSRGFIQTVILLVLAYLVFQIFTPLSFLECLVIALVFAGAASAVGLVIAAIARSEDAATWIAVFFTMAMVTVSGTFFEIKEGTVMSTISKVSLNTYANDAFKTIISQGGSLGDLGFELAVLCGVMVVGLLLSRILFRIMPGGR